MARPQRQASSIIFYYHNIRPVVLLLHLQLTLVATHALRFATIDTRGTTSAPSLGGSARWPGLGGGTTKWMGTMRGVSPSACSHCLMNVSPTCTQHRATPPTQTNYVSYAPKTEHTHTVRSTSSHSRPLPTPPIRNPSSERNAQV